MVCPRCVQVFDDYLQQLGEDTAAYVRTVCQTIVLTVPKAVIHCQVALTAVPVCLSLFTKTSVSSSEISERSRVHLLGKPGMHELTGHKCPPARVSVSCIMFKSS